MRSRKRSFIQTPLCILPLGLLSLLLTSQAHAQVIVIANPDVPVSTITRAELRDIFTGATTSLKDGMQITPVLLKPGTSHDEFLELYVGKTDSAFRASWRSILFSGQGVLPRSLDPEAAMVAYVARTAGAIGYIALSTPHDGVRILVVR